MNLTRLLQMSPAELSTRAQQAFSKRWSKPPACRLIQSSAARAFPDLPPLASLAPAEKICQHRFDLLGYKDLDFGTPIDWHFDPVHRKRAPRKPGYQIPFLDFNQIGDHKIIWELNRHQHLVTVQLPDDFVVADLVEVEEWDLVPGLAGGALAVHGVEVPVDGGAEIEVFVA